MPSTPLKINPIVSRQLPDFVREDHATLVLFLESYYEWLETEYGVISPERIGEINNIDTTVDYFIESFRNQYLKNFPKVLAESFDGTEASIENLIKNVKDFYQVKGTEASFKFLFRLIFGVDVETYLPKTDILVASGSNYIQQTSIKLTNSIGPNIFKAAGKQIKQIDLTDQSVKATARCERVIVYREENFDVAELFLANLTGTFEPSLAIQFSDSGITYTEQSTYSIVESITITNGGTGYAVGDPATISGSNGVSANGEVSRIGNLGDIKAVRLIDFGVNYKKSDGAISVAFTRSEGSTGAEASGEVVVGPLARYDGFYDSEQGHISTKKVLQDNIYYQAYSYVLKSEIVISRYKNFIKDLVHPAGFAFFGAVEIIRCFEDFLESEVSVTNFVLPVIGNYTPYTLGTSSSLDGIHSNGYLSPILGEILSSATDPAGFPFWDILPHPNSQNIPGITEGIEFGEVVIGDFVAYSGGYSHICTSVPNTSILSL